MNKTLAEAGWNYAPGILSGYVEPFDTWPDMSHLIARERWPASANAKQVAYFCNVIPDDPLAPFDDPTYPANGAPARQGLRSQVPRRPHPSHLPHRRNFQ